jgi:parallel beta-helix repeat protein
MVLSLLANVPDLKEKPNKQFHLSYSEPIQIEYSVSRAKLSDNVLYKAHSPISIESNADFITQATSENWKGNGSVTNPYLIEGLAIIGPSDRILIKISNTDVHFRITNCYLSQGNIGISYDHTTNSHLSHNIVTNNGRIGINLDYSQNNILINNTVTNNSGTGVSIEFSGYNNLSNNMIFNNNGIGISIYSSGYGSLSNNMIINNSGRGISLVLSEHNILLKNTVSNNSDTGIFLDQSQYNIVASNTVTNNYWTGIFLRSSGNNNLAINTVTNNGGFGIILHGSSINTLAGNAVINSSDYGIYITGEYNTIHDNNFYNNGGFLGQAYDNVVGNNFTWNYWDGWTSPDNDGDGVVDKAYLITGDPNNSDPYPSVTPRHLVFGFFLNPKAREILTDNTTIRWIAVDMFDHDITHSVFYSSDGGITWILIEKGLNDPFYNWDTTTVADGSQYKIQVNFSCSDGAWNTITSEILIVDNLSHLQSFTILSPIGGKVYIEPISIIWTPAEDVFNHDVTYTVSYSSDNGSSWIILTSQLTTTSYLWDTISITKDTQYLIRINASCSEGSWRITTSNVFTISPPPSHSSTSLTQLETPLIISPILQIIGLSITLCFIIILMIIIRRQQRG